MAEIQILVDGRRALTTAMAAAEFGYTEGGMRAVFSKNGIEPAARLNTHVPLYDEKDLVRALRARPGRGTNKHSPKGPPWHCVTCQAEAEL